MVIVIVFLALIAVSSGRSNAPQIAGDETYPHYVCSFREYCNDSGCTRDRGEFVIYTAFDDGNPRIEIADMSPRLSFSETNVSRKYETRGGTIEAVFEMFPNREFNMKGASGSGTDVEDHYGTGQCERLRGG